MSGPWLATTDVWILVSSSVPLAKVWKLTVAPVCVWNAADTSLNHCCCSAPYLPSAPIRTVSVWPAPLIEALGLFDAPDPPHAVTTSAVMATPAVSVANLLFLVSILFFLLASPPHYGPVMTMGEAVPRVVGFASPSGGERGRSHGRRSGRAPLES